MTAADKTIVAASYVDVVLGERPGFLAVAFGHDGYWDDAGKYQHRSWTERRYPWPAGREQLQHDITREILAGRVDVYVCPAVRHTDRRKGSALPPMVCWADLDGPAADELLLATLETFTVESGSDGHQHVYVPLSRPVDLGTHARLNKALAARLGGDAKWSDEALLRLPGTLNHKTDPPTVVTPLPWSGRIWDPDELAALLGVDPSAAVVGAPSNGVMTVAAAEPAPEPLPALVRSALTHPDTFAGAGKRSEAHHRLIGACHRAGLTHGQALTLAAGYAPSVDKYGARLATEVARSWSAVATGGDGGDQSRSSLTADADDTDRSAEDAASSWEPVDLTPYLDGTITRPVPGVLFRRDGIGLLYPGKVHWAHGESESGKSWVAQITTVIVIRSGRRVLYLDHESDPEEITARLLALGADPADILEHLVYIRPDDSSMIVRNATVLTRLLSQRFELGVVDGVTDALGLDQASSKDLDEVAAWMRRMPRRIAASTGAAVIAVDHVTKDSDSRGRFAIGSQAKMSGIDGAAFVVEPAQPLGEGLVGEIVLRVAKDRPGSLRRHGGSYRKSDRTQEIARIKFDGTAPKHIAITISGPDATATDAGGGSTTLRPTTLMMRVSHVLAQHPEALSSNGIAERVEGNRKGVLAAVDALVSDGYVERSECTRGAITTYSHRLLKPYPESDALDKQLSVGFRPTTLMARVSNYLSTVEGGIPGSEIEADVKGKREGIRRALEILVTDGYVTRSAGADGAVLHHHVRRYSELDDLIDRQQPTEETAE